VETIIFELDEIKNQTSKNYSFDFTLPGVINKKIKPITIEGEIKLAEIKNKTANCQLNIKENCKADLRCQLNIEKYKEYKTLSFKVSEIGNENNKIYLSKINEILLINEENEKGINEQNIFDEEDEEKGIEKISKNKNEKNKNNN
jgi:hypothetical protein